MKEKHADACDKNRLQKISQAGIQHMSRIDGENIYAPVNTHQHTTDHAAEHYLFIMKDLSDISHPPGHGQMSKHKNHGPDHSLGQYISGIYLCKKIPKYGE